MDLRRDFRNLVTGKYMPDFDYGRCKFSFSTVFFKTGYSYCCCKCSFEHEYMSYLTDEGDINEEEYEKVVQNIIDGKCQHVDKVPAEYIKETCISALHIATAVGTEKAIERHTKQLYVTGGVFRLNPDALAVIKNNCKLFEIIRTGYSGSLHMSQMFVYATRCPRNEAMIKIQKASLLELAVKKRNMGMLRNLQNYCVIPAGVPKALQTTIIFGMRDIQNIIVEYIQSLAKRGKIVNVLSCAEVAVIFDKPTILEEIIKHLPRTQCHGTLKHWLWPTSAILQRQECKTILAKYDASDAGENLASHRTDNCFNLLEKFYDFCQNEVVAALKADQESLQSFIHRSETWFLHAYLNSNKRHTDIRVLTTMFELGVNVDTVNQDGDTLLIHLLKRFRGYYMTYKTFIAILETIVYENPKIRLNESAVDLGLCIDTGLHVVSCAFEYDLEGDYKTDAKLHTVFHDDSIEAVSFVGPLLIECGFPVKTDKLQCAIDEKSLPPVELAYFQKCLEQTRPLMLQCRDVLRKHFTGRKLHGFIECQAVPNKIKDFILIKNLRGTVMPSA